MRQGLVVFGEDWGNLPSSTQHLMKHIAKHKTIVWVNSIGLRKPKFTRHDLLRMGQKLFSKASESKQNETVSLPKNFYVVSPLTIPVPVWPLTRLLARWLLLWQIRPLLNKLDLDQFDLWLSLPTAVDIVGYLGEQRVIYYCGDDFSGLAGVDHKTVSLRERELVERADLVFVSSETLQHKLSSPNTYYLPHGVDFQLFANPVLASSLLPKGKPTAGFYGSISQWLDQSLLTSVIAKMPDWDFVFIGKASVDVSALKAFPNVFFINEVPHSTLPQFSQHWDVALLPFVMNSQIQACNPLKLREYLATGRPIISTRFPAVEAYQEWVHIVDDADAFCDALRVSMHVKTSQEQQSLAAKEDWSCRADEILCVLKHYER